MRFVPDSRSRRITLYHKLERTGREALEFNGELIIAVKTPTIEVGGGTSHYRLLVFRHAEGGYVASIRYTTTAPTEHDATLTERLETDHDVENFFFAFEPAELCAHHETKLNRGADRHRLLRVLYGYYIEEVQRVVDCLRANQAPCSDASNTEAEDQVAIQESESVR